MRSAEWRFFFNIFPHEANTCSWVSNAKCTCQRVENRDNTGRPTLQICFPQCECQLQREALAAAHMVGAISRSPSSVTDIHPALSHENKQHVDWKWASRSCDEHEYMQSREKLTDTCLQGPNTSLLQSYWRCTSRTYAHQSLVSIIVSVIIAAIVTFASYRCCHHSQAPKPGLARGREGPLLRVLIFDVHNLMLFTKTPHPTPLAKQYMTPIIFKTVILFSDSLTKLWMNEWMTKTCNTRSCRTSRIWGDRIEISENTFFDTLTKHNVPETSSIYQENAVFKRNGSTAFIVSKLYHLGAYCSQTFLSLKLMRPPRPSPSGKVQKQLPSYFSTIQTLKIPDHASVLVRSFIHLLVSLWFLENYKTDFREIWHRRSSSVTNFAVKLWELKVKVQSQNRRNENHPIPVVRLWLKMSSLNLAIRQVLGYLQ